MGDRPIIIDVPEVAYSEVGKGKGDGSKRHKNMELFKRYITRTEEEMRELVPALVDTNMDTK
jgi:hypothetical protein